MKNKNKFEIMIGLNKYSITSVDKKNKNEFKIMIGLFVFNTILYWYFASQTILYYERNEIASLFFWGVSLVYLPSIAPSITIPESNRVRIYLHILLVYLNILILGGLVYLIKNTPNNNNNGIYIEMRNR